jgi:hypothetical protein
MYSTYFCISLSNWCLIQGHIFFWQPSIYQMSGVLKPWSNMPRTGTTFLEFKGWSVMIIGSCSCSCSCLFKVINTFIFSYSYYVHTQLTDNPHLHFEQVYYLLTIIPPCTLWLTFNFILKICQFLQISCTRK